MDLLSNIGTCWTFQCVSQKVLSRLVLLTMLMNNLIKFIGNKGCFMEFDPIWISWTKHPTVSKFNSKY